MPKMKTVSAAKKRFKRLGSGKIKRATSYRRHLLTKKGPKRRRQLRKGSYVCERELHKIAACLPY